MAACAGDPTVVRKKKKVSPATRVQLSLECRDLRNADIIGKSDPLCVVYRRETKHLGWRELGRTETIDNNLNPKWVHTFEIDYFFETRQYMRFEVYDVDSKTADLNKHDALGSCECTLGNIFRSSPYVRPLGPLRGQKGKGEIIIVAEELSASKEEITMQWRGRSLDKKDFFGSSDPFLRLSRVNTDGSFTAFHETEVIKNNLNPEWRAFTVPARKICYSNGDYNRKIKVECLDWNRNKSPSLIGEFTTTLQTITKGPGNQNEYTLINPKLKEKGKGYTGSGKISLVRRETKTFHTFLDFIQAGLDVRVTVAVDLSASNKDPSDPSSLHHRRNDGETHYSRSIRAVVDILEDYDTDKRIPAYAFGAKMHNQPHVTDLYPMNGNPSEPECLGMEGTLVAYLRCLQLVRDGKLELFGPTNFAPVINDVAKQAREATPGPYFILLILTDGEVNDMEATKLAIINACSLPVSIIIVGIGDDTENFEGMRDLDGDLEPIKCRDKVASRDIVQFVQMCDYDDGIASKSDIAHGALAADVLHEIPTQVTESMKSRNIHPAKRPTIRTTSVMFVQMKDYGEVKDSNFEIAISRDVLQEVPDQVLSYMRANRLHPARRPTRDQHAAPPNRDFARESVLV